MPISTQACTFQSVRAHVSPRVFALLVSPCHLVGRERIIAQIRPQWQLRALLISVWLCRSTRCGGSGRNGSFGQDVERDRVAADDRRRSSQDRVLGPQPGPAETQAFGVDSHSDTIGEIFTPSRYEPHYLAGLSDCAFPSSSSVLRLSPFPMRLPFSMKRYSSISP